jgi:hypothetical protein
MAHGTAERSAAVAGERESARDVEDEERSMGQRQMQMVTADCTWLDGNEKSISMAEAGVVTPGMCQNGRGDWNHHLRRTLHHSVKPAANARSIPSRGSHVHSASPMMNIKELSEMMLLSPIATVSRNESRRPPPVLATS